MRLRMFSLSAAAAAFVAAGAACNGVLGIHEAADQEWDGGSGSGTSMVPITGTSTSGTSSGSASGTTTVSPPDAANDAPTPTDAGTTLHPWAAWPMPNPPSTGLPNPQSYDAGTAGIVFDNVTGLTWEQAVASAPSTWSDALAYCKALTLAGGGWRLPSRIELMSIVDFTQVPTIDAVHFPATPMDGFWSGSLLANDAAHAWTVNFGFTVTPSFNSPLNAMFHVRCVR